MMGSYYKSVVLASSGAQTVNYRDVVVHHITPTGNTTLNAVGGELNQPGLLVITTSGVTSYNITLGTGYVSKGVFATGTVDGVVTVLQFISDGTNFVETTREGAATPGITLADVDAHARVGIPGIVNTAVRALATNFTVTIADAGGTVACDCSGGNRTGTLPAIASVPAGFAVRVFADAVGANTITVSGDANINGAATKVLDTQYQSFTFQKIGVLWRAF